MKSLSLNKPHMIVMVGVPGSGKSFFAEKFAETFRAPYISYEKIAAHLREEKDAAESILQYQLDELLKAGQSIIIDGIGATRASRSELSRKARASGYETLLVWVQTDSATAKDRALKSAKNNTSSTLTPEDYDRSAKHFSSPMATEKPVVISGKHTYATQAKVVLKKLSGPRAEISAHPTAPIRTEQPGRRNITIR